MEIITKEFELTEKEIFKIGITFQLLPKIKWDIFYIILGIGFIASNIDIITTSIGIFLIVISILSPLINIMHLKQYSKSRQIKAFLGKRLMIIDDNFIDTKLANGNEGKYKVNNIVKVLEQKEYLLLYINKKEFLYVPKNAFKNQEDYQNVIRLLEHNSIKFFH
ncbi:MAG: YcxB family protein [Cyanobacteriota bacterium]